MNNNPIGVMDSGIGGINVLKSLVEKFPNEDFIYVADTLNCPYGTKSPEEIKELVTRVSNYLINKGCKAIVIACNTATAHASHLFDQDETIVLGVINPTANEAIKRSKKIAILATNATIASGIYQNLLLNANKEVYPIKCSVFVEAIEKGEINSDYAKNLVFNHLKDYQDKEIDTVILGCTHFDLYKNHIKKVFKNARIVSSGKPTSAELERLLKKHYLFTSKTSRGKVHLKTTLAANLLKDQMQIFDLDYEFIEKIII